MFFIYLGMLLLPFDRKTYVTQLSIDEVKNRLHVLIADEDGKYTNHSEYLGKIEGDNFYFYHSSAYGRQGLIYSSLIKGELKSDNGKVYLETQSRMVRLVFALFVIFITIFTTSIISSESIEINGAIITQNIWLYKLGIFLFIYSFFIVPYKFSNYRKSMLLQKTIKAVVIKK